MLNELTPSQTAAMKPHADKWTKIGLNTAPLDRAKARAAVELAYECAGLKAPAKFVWCSSPMAMDLAYRLVGGGSLVMNEVWAAVHNSVYNSVSYTARISALNVVYNTVHNTASDVVYNTIINVNEVSDSIWSGVSDSLWEAGLGSSWDQGQLLPQNPLNWCYGSMDADSLSFYSFFRDHCGLVQETSKLEGLIAVAQECGWLTPCEDIVFVSSKPTKIDRKVITYADGSCHWII